MHLFVCWYVARQCWPAVSPRVLVQGGWGFCAGAPHGLQLGFGRQVICILLLLSDSSRCDFICITLHVFLPSLVRSTLNWLFITFLFFICFDRGFGSSPEKAPFRDAYSKIGNVRGFTRAPLLCLTATAARKTRKQIIKTLYMKMSVQKLSQEEDLEITFSWLTEELKTEKNKVRKTVIYCRSVNACGELYSMLDSVLDGDAISNIAMFHSKTP